MQTLYTLQVPGRAGHVLSMPDSKGRAMRRSVTYEGIAAAMAQQWGYVDSLTRG